jgi:hypothetical protein
MHTPASLRSQLIKLPHRVSLAAFFSSLTLSTRRLQGVCILAPSFGEVFSPGFFDEPIWADHLFRCFIRKMAKQPSLAFSVLVACASTVHVGILAWRAYYKKSYDLWPVFLSCILFIINLLLVGFSVVRTNIALEILLSLASGILILYQVCFLPF